MKKILSVLVSIVAIVALGLSIANIVITRGVTDDLGKELTETSLRVSELEIQIPEDIRQLSDDVNKRLDEIDQRLDSNVVMPDLSDFDFSLPTN